MIDNLSNEHLKNSLDVSDLNKFFQKSSHANLDDFIAFSLYFDDALENNEASFSTLKNKQVQILQLFEDLTYSYSWTCCPPLPEIFKISCTEADAGIPHLFCKKRVGDHLQEEWLVVYILWKISALLDDLTVTVYDNDGAFLLIEAAYGVPSWMKPENADNRVFLRQGHFCVLCHAPNKRVALKESLLKLIREKQLDTLTLPIVHQCLLSRIQPFEHVLKTWETLHNNDSFCNIKIQFRTSSCLPHSCIIIVPSTTAKLLTLYPQLIGAALDFLPPDEYFNKKSSTAKKKKHLFNFSTDTEESCAILVTLTRYQYARLQSFHFTRPLLFALTSWKIPPLVDKQQCISAIDFGSKICLGLFIACHSDLRCPDLCTVFLWDRCSKVKSHDPIHTINYSKQYPNIESYSSNQHFTSQNSFSVSTQKTKLCAKKQLIRFHELVVSCEKRQAETPLQSSSSSSSSSSSPLLNTTLSSKFFLDSSSLQRLSFAHLLQSLYSKLSCTEYSFVFQPFQQLKSMESDIHWLDLQTHDLDSFFTSQSKEDRFFHFLQEKSCNQLPRKQCESNHLLKNVENLLNSPSDYRGVTRAQDTSVQSKILNLGNIPEEFVDLYEKWVQTKELFQSDSEVCSESQASSLTDISCDMNFEEFSPQDFPDNQNPTYSFAAISTAMDQELEQMLINENAKQDNPFKIQHTSSQENEQRLKENFQRSQNEEPFLQPGPASLLLFDSSQLKRYFES